MGWDRQKPLTTAPPAPFSTGRWLLSGGLAVLSGGVLFVLHASGSLNLPGTVNIWLFSLCPVLLWLLTFSLRGYFYGRGLAHVQFLQQEADYAQQQWMAWAERYLAVLASCVMLPAPASVGLLQHDVRGVAQRQGQVCRIDYLAEGDAPFIAALDGLLAGIQDALSALPRTLPLQVTLITDEPEIPQALRALFDEGWQQRYPGCPAPSSLNITDRLSFLVIDERLKQPDATVQLVLVVQLQGAEAYSDGLAALLFTSDDVAHKYALPHPARLLRPMPLKVDNLADELALFLTTQAQAQRTVAVVGDHEAWAAASAGLMTSGNALGTAWRAEDIQIIERYCGLQGPLSPWLTAALGADIVGLGQQPWLALSAAGAERVVYTITTGSGDEHTG
jgi:hypothetical protein